MFWLTLLGASAFYLQERLNRENNENELNFFLPFPSLFCSLWAQTKTNSAYLIQLCTPRAACRCHIFFLCVRSTSGLMQGLFSHQRNVMGAQQSSTKWLELSQKCVEHNNFFSSPSCIELARARYCHRTAWPDRYMLSNWSRTNQFDTFHVLKSELINISFEHVTHNIFFRQRETVTTVP